MATNTKFSCCVIVVVLIIFCTDHLDQAPNDHELMLGEVRKIVQDSFFVFVRLLRGTSGAHTKTGPCCIWGGVRGDLPLRCPECLGSPPAPRPQLAS